MAKSDIPKWEDTIESSEIPTWDDTVDVSDISLTPPHISTTADVVTSALDAPFLGFSDELAGGAEALGRAVGITGLGASDFSELGVEKPTGFDIDAFMKNYIEAQQKMEQFKKERSERSPVASTIGDIAGGVIVPIGALGKAKTAGEMVKQGIKTGIGMGAISGIGGSDASIMEEGLSAVEDLALEGLKGGALGGVLGGVTAGTLEAGKGIGKFIANRQTVKDLIKTKNLTALGIDLKDVSRLTDKTRSILQDISDELKKADKQTSDMVFKTGTELNEKTKIPVLKTYVELQKKLEKIDPIGETETKAFDNIKKTLDDLINKKTLEIKTFQPKNPKVVQEVVQEFPDIVSYGLASKIPSVSSKEKSLNKILDKKAKSELERITQIEELKAVLSKTTDENEIESLTRYINKLESQKAQPITPNIDSDTQITANISSRGHTTKPIVETISDIPPVPILQKETIKIPSVIAESTPILENPRVTRLFEAADRPDATPGQINSAISSIGEEIDKVKKGIISSGDSFESSPMLKVLQDARDRLLQRKEEGIQNVPEAQRLSDLIKTGKDLYHKQKGVRDLTGLTKKLDPETYASDINANIEQLETALKQAKELSIPGSKSNIKHQEVLKLIENTHADLANKIKQLPESAEKLRLAEMIAGTDKIPNSSIGMADSLSNLIRIAGGTLQNIAFEGAIGAGKLQKTLTKDVPTLLSNVTSSISNATPDALKQLTTKLASKPTAQAKRATNALTEVLSKPEARQKAYIFTLMQQPWFRDAIKESEDNPE